MIERLVVLTAILEGFAEREVQMETILAAERRRRETGLHRRDLFLGELECLQVRQAPPCLAKSGAAFNRAAIDGHGLVNPPQRLQRIGRLISNFGLSGTSATLCS